GRLRTGLTPGDTSSWGYSGNPFGDDECGKFYARAMSSWSLLIASQGLVLDGPAGVLGFRPNWRPEEHRSFFTAPEGWGLFVQTRAGGRQKERIEVRYGRLRLAELLFSLPPEIPAAGALVTVGGRPVAASFQREGDTVRLRVKSPVTVREGDVVEVLFGR
ncbi:MAG: glucosylceramidase, partial [Armatimonadota bacterium]|nr:glucosylceramidase [Armatimonadota bacterium]